MQKKVSIKLLPSEAADEAKLNLILAQACAVSPSQITGHQIQKKSIDARSRKQVWVQLTVNVFIDEPFTEESSVNLLLQDIHGAERQVIIVGAGPAGLFAAIRL